MYALLVISCVPCKETQLENNLFLSLIISTSKDITLATRMTTFGNPQPFNPDSDSATACVERARLFFAANDVPKAKQVAVFLSIIGGRTYELLRNLVFPDLPETLALAALTGTLIKHFEPTPIVIAERFHFHCRNQGVEESIADFMAQLRRLSKHCQFEGFLDDALRDRLVCGLRNEDIQRRLLSEAKLTLARALELAQGMEAAERNARTLKGSEAAVHKMYTPAQRGPATQRPPTGAPCYRCGRSNHDPKDCRHRESVCHFCNKKGHIAPACRGRQSKNGQKPTQKTFRGKRQPSQQTSYVATDDGKSETELPLFMVGNSASNPLYANVLVVTIVLSRSFK